jgi:V/A-type H+/Na+-transporting ATPase subunit F
MKIFVIGADAAVWGFALTGVPGRIVENAGELNSALDEALQAEDIGIILITSDVVGLAQERIEALLVQPEGKLVLEIPGPEGASTYGRSIGELLRRTVGVKI